MSVTFVPSVCSKRLLTARPFARRHGGYTSCMDAFIFALIVIAGGVVVWWRDSEYRHYH